MRPHPTAAFRLVAQLVGLRMLLASSHAAQASGELLQRRMLVAHREHASSRAEGAPIDDRLSPGGTHEIAHVTCGHRHRRRASSHPLGHRSCGTAVDGARVSRGVVYLFSMWGDGRRSHTIPRFAITRCCLAGPLHNRLRVFRVRMVQLAQLHLAMCEQSHQQQGVALGAHIAIATRCPTATALFIAATAAAALAVTTAAGRAGGARRTGGARRRATQVGRLALGTRRWRGCGYEYSNDGGDAQARALKVEVEAHLCSTPGADVVGGLESAANRVVRWDASPPERRRPARLDRNGRAGDARRLAAWKAL